MTDTIYLDFNATAPVRPAVLQAMTAVMAQAGNPSSVHQYGRTARNRVEEARRQLAKLVNCKPQEVIFTSGGTEANNLALGAISDRPLMVSAIEHDSILSVAGNDTRLLAVDIEGRLKLDALESSLDALNTPALLSVMLANNETGVIQSISDIREIAGRYGAFLHCDAIQAVGKTAVDFKALDVDMMSISAHKFGGPQGVGALIVREGIPITSLVKGGGQELGRRAGTENVAGIVGLGVAAQIAFDTLAEYEHVEVLRDKMEAAIHDISPETVFYGQNTRRLPNTSTLSMPAVPSELQVMSLDLAGIAVSAGSACSSGKVKASHVLIAMGASEEEAGSAIRVSLGWSTTEDDVAFFVENWGKLYRRKSPKYAA